MARTEITRMAEQLRAAEASDTHLTRTDIARMAEQMQPPMYIIDGRLTMLTSALAV